MVDKIGRFEILSKIADGTAGSVYRAKEPSSGRDVAVKTVRLDPRLSPDARERLMREARTIGALSHPNIVTVFDVGDSGDYAYLAMEYVDGQGLNAVISEGAPFRPLAIIPWLDQIADALDYAHRRGVVHKDIKPANILLTRIGQIKVSDFGFASMASMASPEGNLWVGTPRYMSPEQIKGDKVDHKSDVFSFGVVVYEMLTGRHPFESDTVVSTIYKVVNEQALPAHQVVTTIGEDVGAALQRALEKSPEARFASARELVEALRASAKRSAELTPTVPLAATGPVGAPTGGRFCDQCGTALRPNVRFCYRCGAEAIAPEGAEAPPPQPPAEQTHVLASGVEAPPEHAPPRSRDLFRTNPEELEAAPPAPVRAPQPAPTVPDIEFERTVALYPEDRPSTALHAPPERTHPVGLSTGSIHGDESTPLPRSRMTAPPLAGYARSTGSRELPPPDVQLDMPVNRRGFSDYILPAAFLVALLAGSGLLGYWLGPKLISKAPARGNQPAAPAPENPAPAPEAAPADEPAPEAEQPAPAEPTGAFAATVVASETEDVDNPDRALGQPDGRFARIPPGGSLVIALPQGQLLRDDGTNAPDVRVVGAQGDNIAYTISARTASGAFVIIDRVRRFGSHDLNHHRVASADAFKIQNTSRTNAMLVDAVEALRQLSPK
jgi:hypothetical protein